MPGGIHPPQSVIATWPTPNYKDPVTQGNGVVVTTIIFSAVGILVVLARSYSRLFITKVPGIDDGLAILSLLFALAVSVIAIYTNQHLGVGRHVWDVPQGWFWKERVYIWVLEWCFIFSTVCIKISILLFYKRLSAPFTKAFLIATWAGIGYNIVYTIIFFLVMVLQCRPVEAFWRQVDPTWILAGHKYTCLDEALTLPISAVFSIFGDLYATLLPLLLVYNLQMPPRQKVALYGLFCFGFLTVIAGILRAYYVHFTLAETYDNTWYVWIAYFPTVLELYVAIIAASAPSLKPFFLVFFIDPVRTRTRSGTESSSHGASRALPSRRGAGSRFSFVIPLQHNQKPALTIRQQQEVYLDIESCDTSNDGHSADSKYNYEMSDTKPLPASPPNNSDYTTTTQLPFSRHPAITGGKGNLTPRGASTPTTASANPFSDEPLSSRVAALNFERQRRQHSWNSTNNNPSSPEPQPQTRNTSTSRKPHVVGTLDLSSDKDSSEPETEGDVMSRSSSRATENTTATAKYAGTGSGTRPRDFVYDHGGATGRRG